MPNEVLLAALAIGAIFLVVKSGDKEKTDVANKRSADEAGGMTSSEAKKANPTEGESDDRQLWMNRLMECEKEYADLVRWEADNGAILQQQREFPKQQWHRIRVLRDRLVEIARVAKTIFDDQSHGADSNFWDRFNGLWNGTQKFGETQQGLLKSKPVTAGSKSAPTHVGEPAPGPADQMDLVLFNQSPAGIDVPKFTTADLLKFNQANFNLLGQRQAILANIISGLNDRVEAAETTNRQDGAFRTNSGPTTNAEKASDTLNNDLGGANKSDNSQPKKVPGNRVDKRSAGWGPNRNKSDFEKSKPTPNWPKPYDAKKQPSLVTGSARPAAIGPPEMTKETTTTTTEKVTIPAAMMKAAAAAFNAAPTTNTHKDEPPALPPPKKHKALPAPVKPSKAIQKAFNSDSNPAINLSNKPANASQAVEEEVVRKDSTLPRKISAEQAGINLQKKLEVTAFTEVVNKYRDQILHGMKTLKPTQEQHEEARVAVYALRDALPANADNKDMFRSQLFRDFPTKFSKDLNTSIRRMPAYKVWAAAVNTVMPKYQSWSRKRAEAPAPLQEPEKKAKRSRPSRTQNSKTRSSSRVAGRTGGVR